MINDTDTESNIAEQERRNIEDLGSVETKNPRGNIHCLNIIGQVEGHMVLPPQNKTTKYEHVLPQLIAIEENPEIDGLMVLLNTVGGDVEAGLAIAEMVAGMSKPTVSLVLGGRTQYRCTACGCNGLFIHCTDRNYDSASAQNERRCNRRYADISIFSEYAGQNN